MKHENEKPCLREVNDCIEGDSIFIECRTPGDWKLFNMSGNHKGSCCVIKKNAKARIQKKYTNISK
jgi:hypothetical protein